MIALSGERPEVLCSGWSEKALRNPVQFFSRYRRTVNASSERAVALFWYISLALCTRDKKGQKTYFSAESTMMPVISSMGMPD